MIYLDNGATSLIKPKSVKEAMLCALENCGNPGRGGYQASLNAAKTVLNCRTLAAEMFDCRPEQVVMTTSCTHGLNIAIRTLVKPGSRVVISGFEHNAVTRPLHALQAKITVAGRKLFDWEDTLQHFEAALKQGQEAAVFTQTSNVFGYILPVAEMAALCKQYGVPFVVDAAQSAGSLPVSLGKWGADFVAMPGHKGLLGPQGTGLLLCGNNPKPLLFGGTGSNSASPEMPDFLPDILEPGTLNVPGIAGLAAGLTWLKNKGIESLHTRQTDLLQRCIRGLKKLGLHVFSGPHQSSTLSFVPPMDSEELAQQLGDRGIAVRAGLHCAPLAHESADTLETGTVRISLGHHTTPTHIGAFIETLQALLHH